MLYPMLEQYDVNREKALAYGFVALGDTLCLQKALDGTEFYVKVTIAGRRLEVNVFDSDTDEEYLPFNVPDNISGYVMSVREKVEALLAELKEQCLEKSNVKLQLLEYCSQTFGTTPEAPWADTPYAFTLKTARKNKWYALLTTIPYKSLGIEQAGRIDIMNIKLPPEKITQLVDRVSFYPAYHMNKKHWLTVLLKKDLDMALVQELVAESYSLVEKRKA